jgi:hypothetical protein
MPLRNTKNFEFPFKTGFDMITTEWYTRATVSKSKDNNSKTIFHVEICSLYWLTKCLLDTGYGSECRM